MLVAAVIALIGFDGSNFLLAAPLFLVGLAQPNLPTNLH
jgi:hypothetical protein